MGKIVTACLWGRELEAMWAFIAAGVDGEMQSPGHILEEIDNIYKVTWKNFLRSVGNEKKKENRYIPQYHLHKFKEGVQNPKIHIKRHMCKKTCFKQSGCL